MKRHLLLSALLAVSAWLTAVAQTTFKSNIVTDEGAWCWFADPRALHYENETSTINATYLGYIDVHGNIKATQYDWLTGQKADVLIRSYFQPDDHNNPTFLVLPDERVLIIYCRHTDEAAFYYRISVKPGDITQLGEEKRIATANNTTYPSPFILSDDPQHWYLCWRGIGWHPTIARLTMPDENDDVQFDYGPKQIVQSTGTRPYCKYASNGKDKIYLAYTTGHPDNEMPDWLYMNYIDINGGGDLTLHDLTGTKLKTISDGPFNVSKTDSYASTYPKTIVDKTANIRNWVWQVVLDKDEHPVIAYPHIDDAKTTHTYWYARWNGTSWKNTWVCYAGHAFHQNWNSTERCYSGGMSLDPDNINDLYLSIPTTNGQYDKDGVYEIWKYTINDEGSVAASEQITTGSTKNNARPYVIPGSKNSPMRLGWINGDYYYWIVKQGYPKGYPTAMHCNYEWMEEMKPLNQMAVDCICLHEGETMEMAFAMNKSKYYGTLLSADNGNFSYSINADTQRPEITIGNKTYTSQNRLLTSDDWATMSTGTSGDNHPTKLSTWVLTMTYDGHQLKTYRNGFIDQVIDVEGFEANDFSFRGEGFNHDCWMICTYGALATPQEVQQLTAQMQQSVQNQLAGLALQSIQLPAETHTDLVLPASVYEQTVSWASANEAVITSNGCITHPAEATAVKLTATCGTETRDFIVTVLPRNTTDALRYQLAEPLDLTANTAAGFETNKYGLAPEGTLTDLRSFTVLLTANAESLDKAPRFYDFGSASGNSLFLRANPLSAGVKYNGGTTTMVHSATQLQTGKDYKLAVVYEAATQTTRIYIDGEETASGTANQVEAYQLAALAADNRNYIGRTQWWDSSYKADNVDFDGTIADLRLYDIALTRQEICSLQGIPFDEKPLPTALQNGDFEGSYTVMSGSGVSSDRAIYLPEGWSIDYSSPNNNDLTAMKAGDLYFSNFFAALDKPAANGNQTYWVRQNWGTSTITLYQELRLPEGSYVLDVDLWKSGLGGDAVVSVQTEGAAAITAPTLENKAEWQHQTLELISNGKASTTVRLAAKHNSNGSEKIIGFDNVKLTLNIPNGIVNTPADDQIVNSKSSNSKSSNSTWHDLSGRRIHNPALHGIYIRNGQKVVR
ncbi:MAG: BNR-4 repeat-containing protein [Bacteroidaceae bacterium]|nr:BNR-4 repeat-containing protein [Bacteroidaceae bacterium]